MDTRDSYEEPSESAQAPHNAATLFNIQELVTPAIFNLAALVETEEIIDAMESLAGPSKSSRTLRKHAKAFIAAHPELLDTPWLRCGGAVYDIINQLRNKRDDASAAVITMTMGY